MASSSSLLSRWPEEETMALLQLRSDMDELFRDSNFKRPLWDEISRKMAEMGYERSWKKCKEKFENVYKYHRRTKEGRSVDKAYRFFDLLEAIQSNNTAGPSHAPLAIAPPPPPPPPMVSTSSEEERPSCDRKWKNLFLKLTTEIMERQDRIEMRFLEAMKRKENELKVREESWRVTEIARLEQERDNLIKEKVVASAKEAALISYLRSHQIPVPTEFPILVVPVVKSPILKPEENKRSRKEEDGGLKDKKLKGRDDL